MRVIALQLDIAWEDKSKNYDKVISLLEAENFESGGLCVLPELFSSGFSMNVAKICEPIDREKGTKEFLSRLAKRFGLFVVGGLAELADGNLGRNIACVYAPDGHQIGRYCKIHPFSFGQEDKYYLSGEEIIRFDCNGFVACPFICYDLRFPELFRIAVRRYSANLFLVLANWPAARREHWAVLLRARAIENQAYVIGVNRIGNDINHRYSGDSMIIGPKGEIIALAEDCECVIQGDIDVEVVNCWRDKFPVLNDIKLI